MDQRTARSLFNSLYRALDRTGFKEDVATFLIQLKASEIYPDSSFALNELYNIAQRPYESKYALEKLALATRNYFTAASSIGERYKQLLSDLKNEPAESAKLFLDMDGSNDRIPLDISAALNPPALATLLKMANAIIVELQNGSNDNNRILNELIEI